MTKLLLGIILVSIVSTAGDYVWYEIGVRHRMIAGVIHGAVLLMAVGGALGWPAGRVAAGLQVGIGAGVVGALAYYALVPSLRSIASMIAAWALVWLLLAFGEGRLLHRTRRSWGSVLTRGVIAAVLSGVAFYAISGTIWGRAPAGGRNYLQHFVAWIVAWAPGMIAIAVTRRSPAHASSP